MDFIWTRIWWVRPVSNFRETGKDRLDRQVFYNAWWQFRREAHRSAVLFVEPSFRPIGALTVPSSSVKPFTMARYSLLMPRTDTSLFNIAELMRCLARMVSRWCPGLSGWHSGTYKECPVSGNNGRQRWRVCCHNCSWKDGLAYRLVCLPLKCPHLHNRWRAGGLLQQYFLSHPFLRNGWKDNSPPLSLVLIYSHFPFKRMLSRDLF